MKVFIAIVLYFLGIKPHFTTCIGDWLTAGYGRMSNNGFWEYQLPGWITKRL